MGTIKTVTKTTTTKGYIRVPKGTSQKIAQATGKCPTCGQSVKKK